MPNLELERLAKLKYSNPLLAVALWKRFPEYVSMEVGSALYLPDISNLSFSEITPKSHLLADPESQNRFDVMVISRAK